jgi:type IV pilus assembly protein PilY1
MVFVGTGAYLGVTDISTSQQNTIYAIKDPLTTVTTTGGVYGNPRAGTCSTASTATACFVRQILTDTSGTRTATSSVSYSWSLATMNGWFADLPYSGERIDVDPTLQLGTLAFVSNLPSTIGACSVGGTSYLNYLNFANGLAVAGASNTGVLLSSSGLSSSATLAVTTSGTIVAVTKASDGSVSSTTVPKSSTSTGTRRVSWRRLTDSQ